MSVKKLAVAAGLAVITFAGSANAVNSFLSGNQLYTSCSSQNNVYYQAECLNYIIGAYDAIESVTDVINAHPFCSPIEATKGQIRDIVILWLQKHPEQRHFTASSDILQALREAFPCAK